MSLYDQMASELDPNHQSEQNRITPESIPQEFSQWTMLDVEAVKIFLEEHHAGARDLTNDQLQRFQSGFAQYDATRKPMTSTTEDILSDLGQTQE